MQPWSMVCPSLHPMYLFQSSTRPEGRVQLRSAGVPTRLIYVSILTRPEGRVQRRCVSQRLNDLHVSILTRPEGRVQREYRDDRAVDAAVSILTRPEGRVQPRSRAVVDVLRAVVSILTRPEGRVQQRDGVGIGVDLPLSCFNPHPARRPGATGAIASCRPKMLHGLVSILTRPEGRVQPCTAPLTLPSTSGG